MLARPHFHSVNVSKPHIGGGVRGGREEVEEVTGQTFQEIRHHIIMTDTQCMYYLTRHEYTPLVLRVLDHRNNIVLYRNHRHTVHVHVHVHVHVYVHVYVQMILIIL